MRRWLVTTAMTLLVAVPASGFAQTPSGDKMDKMKDDKMKMEQGEKTKGQMKGDKMMKDKTMKDTMSGDKMEKKDDKMEKK
jgi:pentapeptide MXKDX repeat protein